MRVRRAYSIQRKQASRRSTGTFLSAGEAVKPGQRRAVRGRQLEREQLTSTTAIAIREKPSLQHQSVYICGRKNVAKRDEVQDDVR